MAEVVYVLCSLTSLVCAGLLLRAYLNNRTPLLLWSSLCFVALALNNVLLVIDLIVYPGERIDLRLARTSVSLLAFFLMIYGLVWRKGLR